MIHFYIMELFQRVESILNQKGLARRGLAQLLNVPQNTFNRYFCIEQQEKLASLLWNIWNLFPDVNRNWLFFGEGEMLKANTPESKPACEPVASPATDVQAELEKLRAELDEERRLCRKLTLRLLMEGDPHKDCASGETGTAADGQK